ncbi:MAG TPA: ABC transporter permease [Candidatus Cloacimonas sp.]|jgi:putative ABC transport system permease protein|nr:ABC transporter permease [Candidatus Cloacimonas sp.]MDD2249723.1 ABC transporter permease [Candidatus Cloacimonadota bacterium]MCK9158569.1 ABC transporter permease [Candidatus Cloacimonas sp.]MDD3734200.1 ABC transporter permease [Candidatus Cloacimonadota bacterium]MDD3869303.1 ABC transporter permease [Candidatus Cloacimonadota bacterium]
MAIPIAESLKLGIADILMRKVRSIVTVIGIILGVMCIMVVLAIVNGMNKSTMSWMEERGGLSKIEVEQNWQYDFSKGGDPSFTLKEIRYLQSLLPEAEAFNPSVQEWEAIITKGDIRYSTSLRGVMPDFVKVEQWDIAKGRFIKDMDIDLHSNVVVVGSTVAKEFFGNSEPLGQIMSIGNQQFTVVGVMSERFMQSQGGQIGMGDNALEYLNQRCFIPISTMISKVNPISKISSIDIRAKSPEEAKELRRKVENIVLNLKNGKRLFQVTSAKEQMDTMQANAKIMEAIFILIAVISLLVGGIVIMNIMLASIRERTREIGVRIAVGARSRDIFLQFLVQTILITSLGGVLGILFGFAILDKVGSYLQIEVLASVQMIWVALLVSIGVGLIFGVGPAIRASRLDPVIALREE